MRWVHLFFQVYGVRWGFRDYNSMSHLHYYSTMLCNISKHAARRIHWSTLDNAVAWCLWYLPQIFSCAGQQNNFFLFFLYAERTREILDHGTFRWFYFSVNHAFRAWVSRFWGNRLRPFVARHVFVLHSTRCFSAKNAWNDLKFLGHM